MNSRTQAVIKNIFCLIKFYLSSGPKLSSLTVLIFSDKYLKIYEIKVM